MNKSRNNELIQLADTVLRKSSMYKDGQIPETYNGKTAALSVSVAMSGLLPTLAMYFQDYDKKKPDNPWRRTILDVVAKMIDKPGNGPKFEGAEELLRHAVQNPDDLAYLKKEVIDCAIALKQVIRTYKLVKNEKPA